MSELIVENLRKSYKSRTVVQDISLTIKSGEVVGLLGPNGAGKTTSFYMMVGLVPLDEGRITLDGSNLIHMPIHMRARMGLAYLPQEPSIFRKLTVSENIMAILQLQDISEKEMDEKLEELLEELHITHIRDSAAVSLSGGERRRVAQLHHPRRMSAAGLRLRVALPLTHVSFCWMSLSPVLTRLQ